MVQQLSFYSLLPSPLPFLPSPLLPPISPSPRACLAATIRSSGASQSTIKLVATNLIANSKLIGK